MKTMRGYSDMRQEMLNPYMAPDVKETFDYGLSISGGENEITHLGINRWPTEGVIANVGFRDTSVEYLTEVHKLGMHLVHAVCLGLDLPEDALDTFYDKPLVVNRYIRYPPQPNYQNDFGQQNTNEMGAGSHVDFGAFTLVYQDIAGLEILNKEENAWSIVPEKPGTFVVNSGYILEKLTNGFIPATKHRVINRNMIDRFSIALFLDPNPAREIEPLPKFVTEENPARFEKCVSGHKGVLFGHKDTYNSISEENIYINE